MSSEINLSEEQKLWHGSFKSYVIGFTASLVLTTVSFLLVATGVISGHHLAYTIAGLALIQAVVQLKYFLHVGQEGKPHWETCVFFFMLLILAIIVTGSLWIMYDLDQRTMKMNPAAAHHD